MTALLGLIRAEWLKGQRRPLERFTAAVAASLGVLVPVIMIVVSRRTDAMRSAALAALAFPSSLSGAGAFLGIIGPLCAAALGANIAGAEYQYGTWPWLLVRGVGRWRLFSAKLVVGAAHVVVLALIGLISFMAMGALMLVFLGAPVTANTSNGLAATLYPFVTIVGTMTFAAAIALLVTVAGRSILVGALVGVSAMPVMAAIRFKEMAPWNFYLHLLNVQGYLTGQSSTMLARMYEFDMPVRASAWILVAELTTILAAAYLLFRRQEIVY